MIYPDNKKDEVKGSTKNVGQYSKLLTGSGTGDEVNARDACYRLVYKYSEQG
jgi:hypothetical protein